MHNEILAYKYRRLNGRGWQAFERSETGSKMKRSEPGASKTKGVIFDMIYESDQGQRRLRRPGHGVKDDLYFEKQRAELSYGAKEGMMDSEDTH